MRHLIIIVLLLSLTILTACGTSIKPVDVVLLQDDGPSPQEIENPTRLPEEPSSAEESSPTSGTADRAATGDAKTLTREDNPGPSANTAASKGSNTSSGTGPSHRSSPPRTDLKAGEVDDNARWDEYLRFVEDYQGPRVHDTNLGDRRIITVLDQDGRPVPNAKVTLDVDGEDLAVHFTYADGRTVFFPNEAAINGTLYGTGKGKINGRSNENGNGMTMRKPDETSPTRYVIRAERDGFTNEIRIRTSGDGEHEIPLSGRIDYGNRLPLDVLFLLDATGSMADEIHKIKTTLQSIAQQVSNLPANPDLQFGMVAYRDRGDEYVTHLYDFDGDVERFQRTIRDVSAEGGGDYPESLNQVLHEAVNNASWREDAVRLIFLLADAPPHLDYEQDEDYAAAMVQAREKGIKIFTVASSGLDEQGEYIFRQIAQQTMGRFLFILYQDGTQGRLDTPHSVEQFTVNNLDGLIVRLIEVELAGLAGREQAGMRMK